MAVETVSTFALPNEYQRQAAEARRRRRMAELLAQQAYQPGDIQNAPIPSAAPLVQGLQAFLSARAARKAEEAETAQEAAASQIGERMAGYLMGGGRMPKTVDDLTEVTPAGRLKPETMADLTEVTPEGAYVKPYPKDPAAALRLGMTSGGMAAMKGNPLLASLLAETMKKPETPSIGAVNLGDLTPESARVFARTRNPEDIVYRTPEAKPERLVAVLKNGKPTYVNESEAKGMTPATAQTIKVSTGGGGGGGRGQPPSGYRWTPENTLEPVPGGPDDPTRKRALPNQIVTQVTNERRVGSQLQKTLDRTQDFINMIENGELPLSKLSGIEYGAKRALDNQLNRSGDSTEPYVRYYELQRFVDQQVNRILSLAKGPQTDADAERARRQILDNPDNQKVVLSALEDLRRIWEDEIELSNAAVEDLISPYGAQPVAAPAVPAAPATRKKTKRRTASGIEYEVEE